MWIILGLPTPLLQAFCLYFLALKKNIDNLSIAVRIAELTPVRKRRERIVTTRARCRVRG